MFIGEPIKCLYKCTRQALNINCCLPTEGATQVGNCTRCIQSGRFARVSMVKPLISRGVRLFACVGLQSSCACSNGQSMVVGQPSKQATCDQRRMPPPAMVLSCPYGEYLQNARQLRASHPVTHHDATASEGQMLRKIQWNPDNETFKGLRKSAV